MSLRYESQWADPARLTLDGPIISVQLGHSADYIGRESLTPSVFPKLDMMVDTGARFTLVETDRLVQLGLFPIRFQEIIGVDQVATDCPVFRMSLVLMMKDRMTGRNTAVRMPMDVLGMATTAAHEPYRGLLGRNFLMNFQFEYSGATGAFSLTRRANSAQSRRR